MTFDEIYTIKNNSLTDIENLDFTVASSLYKAQEQREVECYI